MSQSLSVATDILAYCTSCKIDLNHTVVAMKGERVAKVQCLTCKKDHVYRAPKGITQAAPKTPRASAAERAAMAEDSSSSVEAEWTKLMSAHREATSKAYNMRGDFNLGDKIKHPSFGEGIVGKLIYPNKLEVIFRDDLRILVYSGNSH